MDIVDRVLTLRPATHVDIASVLAFWTTAAEDAHRPLDSFDAVAALITRDPDALMLAIDAGASHVVGTLIAGWDGWRCHLYRLAVAPHRRREGIARILVEDAEQRFAAFGGIRADAMILDDNEPAHAAWAAQGYRRQQEWSRWVKPLPGTTPA